MSFEKSPRIRGRYGRAAKTQFVEVEMPEAFACPLIIELDGVGRILLNESAHVVLAAQLLISISGHREGSVQRQFKGGRA